MSDSRRRRWALLVLLLALPLGLAFGPELRAEDEDDPPAPEEPLDDTADGPVPFVDRVNKALDLGTRWLLARPDLFGTAGVDMAHWGLVKGTQNYGGGDGPQYRHPAGPTALALYTLLKCGVDPEHPVIEKGFNWLKTEHPITEEYDGYPGIRSGFSITHYEGRGSYELSVEILALCAKYDQYKRNRNTAERRRRGRLRIKDREDKKWLETLVEALAARRGVPAESASTDEKMGWRYNLAPFSSSSGNQTQNFSSTVPPHANQDLSSTQLATLALFTAHQFGEKVDRDIWFDIVNFTLAHQEEEGPEHKRHDPVYQDGGYAQPVDHARGFMYIPGSTDRSEGKATGSMTACGLANLLMAKDVILETPKGRTSWDRQGLASKVDTAIWDGLAWLDRNWSSFQNPHSQVGYHIYYLYAIERAMDLLGKQLVGSHVWYNEGALAILGHAKTAMVKDLLDDRAPEIEGMYWNTEATHEPKDVLDTCFALLFLKRATRDMVPGGVPVTGGGGGAVDNR